MADSLVIQIDLEKGDVDGAFKGIAKSAGKSGKDSGKKFGSGFKEVLAGNLGADAIKGALRGIASEFSNVISAGKELEVIETQFKTMLGSTKAAQKQLSDLQEFAASTPFQLQGLSTSTRQLLSFGVAQKDIIPTLQKLGDLAAGTGAEISDLAIPFGRLVASQKLTLVELDKFADRGINIYQQFADSTGMSIGEVRDAVSKGKIPFEEFTKAIGGMTGEGGKFFNAMESQSKTLSGVMSTFGDVLFNVRANMGKAFSPLIIKVVSSLTNKIKELSESFDIFDDLITPLLNFNDAFITYVIAPFELLTNILGAVSTEVSAFIATFVQGFGQIGGAAADMMNFFGVDNDMTKGLQAFAETSKQVAEELAAQSGESFASIFDFPISEQLATKNEELRTSLQGMNEIVAEEGAVVAETLKATLEAPTQEMATSMSGLWSSISVGFTKTADVMKDQSKKVAGIVKGSLVKGISGGIQNIANSLVQGENVFKNFGKFVLGIVGDLAIQLGTFYIAQGIALTAMTGLSGPQALIAGAGLVALGAIMKSFSGGGGSVASASGGSGGGSFESSSVSQDSNTAEPDNLVAKTQGTTINLTVEGSLVQQEELGSFIADIQSESNQKNGTVILNPNFA